MQIGSIILDKPLALAPMEDVSDIPFRRICSERGADLVYTEFTNCEALIRNAHRLVLSREPTSEEIRLALEHLGRQQRLYSRANASAEEAFAKSVENFVHMLLSSNEFLYVD